MTSAKRGISIMLIAALIISMFMAFGAVNANAMGKRCSHGKTVTTYKNNHNGTHLKIVKCKKCGATISKKDHLCYQSGGKVKLVSRNRDTHRYRITCICGASKNSISRHDFGGNKIGGKCKKCGYKTK